MGAVAWACRAPQGNGEAQMKRAFSATDVRSALLDSARLKRALAVREAARIARMGALLVAALRRGGRLYTCGNGGSAADAQHVAAELVGTYADRRRRALPALALTTDTSALTAIGNDLGFDQVFARQVEALVRKGDVLLCLSTSGRSPNVLKAAQAARRLGVKILALTGAPGEPLAGMADLAVRVPSRSTARIQECHIAIDHILCEAVERAFI